MNRRIFHFLTPCLIASVGLLVMAIDGALNMVRSKGWSLNGIIVGSSFFALYLISDYLIRRWLPGKLVAIWIIEIVLIILSAILFWNYFPFKHIGHIG
ncbi:hypothetical protein [Ferruginibacter albus]|uniref:hypothetical protein n=1 Tax=Ferruginibacter albus TaxID=2875540 RepID=UPI001CC53E6F|nr:hypothetical protein [Ferruginibacter albus]UAY53408.1 hypothetical protein K9M53_06980 [Ferruginibacter albus]